MSRRPPRPGRAWLHIVTVLIILAAVLMYARGSASAGIAVCFALGWCASRAASAGVVAATSRDDA